MFGRRSDGRRIKNIDPFQKIVPHIMSARHDSQNSFSYEAECEALDVYIAEKREKEGVSYNYMHIVMAAMVRLLALRPQLNRFVMRGKIYKRDKIYMSMAVKKSLKDDSPGTTLKVEFDGTESIAEVKQKADDAIRANATPKAYNDTDKTARKLTRVPNWLIRLGVGALKRLDRRGLLPKKIIAASPFHTSFFITNMKSIKSDYIFHHLYDFGTTGLFVAMGKETMRPVVMPDGSLGAGKRMGMGFVTDERFCDGFYYVTSFRLLKEMLLNPHILDQRLKAKTEDAD